MLQPGKVLLVVEDDSAHSELIEYGFRNSTWKLRTCASLSAAKAELQSGGVDVVLADLNLPDGDATELCLVDLPVVIMTSHGDEDRAVAAIRGGALNYVVKSPQSLRAMPSVVQQALREWQLVMAKREAEQEAQRQSAELERNNQRLRSVLAEVTDLPRVETAQGALGLIGSVVSKQLEADLRIEAVQDDERHKALQLTSPNEVSLHIPSKHGGQGSIITLSRRGVPFDSSELTLVELAAELAKEKVHAIETRTELEESQRRLHQADKLQIVGQLAGGIAHDFNNMLGAIVGAASVIQLDLEQSEEETNANVELILDVADHASQLTRRLLTFSRGGSIVRKPVQVERLIGQLVKMLNHSLNETITVEVSVEGDPWVECDPSLLQTALLNLSFNARDAMPEGGTLALQVRTRQLEASLIQELAVAVEPGPYVEFVVRDTGAGMDEATLARAFEPFFSTKDALSGSGLGLPVVLGMFQDGGGAVRVTSEAGVGTEVAGYLPATPPGRCAKPKLVEPKEFKSLQVLVVDDNLGVLSTTKRLLERTGHVVVSTDDPERALELAQHDTFDVLLVDVAMPTMNGVELVRRLFNKGMRARVVYTSGYCPDRAGLVSIAADPRVSFLPKPFTRDELAQAVETAWKT